MAAFRLDLIGRYLKPHRRKVMLGAIALVVVNILSVTIPLEVKGVVDDLQGGFAYRDVLIQAGWIVLLATTMGVVRLISRQLVFESVARLRSNCVRSCSITCCSKSPAGFSRQAVAK